MKALAVVVVASAMAGIGAGVWFVLSEIGAERVYSLLLIVVLSSLGIAFIRVYLHGLAKIAEAKRAGRPDRERHVIERHTHTIDARPPAPLQLPGLPEPSSMAIFPAMIGAAWRQGIEASGQSESAGEVIDGQVSELAPAQAPSRRVWQ